MTTTAEFREKQVRRMAQLDGYPKFEPEAEAELVLMFGRRGRSEAHIRGVIDGIMDTWTKCPKPSELKALLDSDREERVNLNCSDCRGSGWKIIEKDGQSGAARCPCGSVPPPPGESVRYSDERKSGHVSGLTPVKELLQ